MPAANPPPPSTVRVAIVGGGPAGLMAAETLATAGIHADLFDAMPSLGRKFLLAGKGGLNITHSEAFEAFAGRYGSRVGRVSPPGRNPTPAPAGLPTPLCRVTLR